MSVAINNFNQPIFDVVEYIKKLRSAGVSQEVAEIQGQEIERVVSRVTSEVKAEIKQELHADELLTKKDLEVVKLELQKEIVTANNRTIIWVAGLLGTYGIFFLGVLAKGFHWL